jgi:hypothetical protein
VKITSLAELKNLISTGNCPAEWKLYLYHNRVFSREITALATALYSGNFPVELTVHIGLRVMRHFEAQALAIALQSGNCPAKVTLNLKYVSITDAEAQLLAAAIKHPNAPDHLTIELSQPLMNKPYWQSALKAYRFNRYRKLMVLACGIAGLNKACHLKKLTDNTAILAPIIKFLYTIKTIEQSDQHTQMLVSFIHHHHDLAPAKSPAATFQRSINIFCQSRPGMPQDLTPLDPAHNPYAMIIHSGK